MFDKKASGIHKHHFITERANILQILYFLSFIIFMEYFYIRDYLSYNSINIIGNLLSCIKIIKFDAC